MNERLHTRGLISGRQHVSDMDSGSLREDLLAGRSDMVRNTIMTAAYREATAVLEESRGEEAGDFLAGFVEGAAGAFAALSESVGLPPITRQRRRLRVR